MLIVKLIISNEISLNNNEIKIGKEIKIIIKNKQIITE